MGTVHEYAEELKSYMLHKNPYLTKEYFVLSFVSGLSNELWPTMKLLNPKIVQEAVEGASLQELLVEALMKKQSD